MTSKLRVASLDFNDIKASFIDYLKTTNEFTDFNYEASGLSTLLDVLAYNTHYHGLMANFLANEIYLDTAVKRSSIVSRAKELGYVPFSKKSAVATVNVAVSNVSGNPSSLLLPSNTQFVTTINNTTYTFVTLQSYSSQRQYVGSQYVYYFNNVEIYEGLYVQNKFTWNNVDPTIDLPNIDIDTATLRVFVQEPSDSIPQEYTQANSLADISDTTKVFFFQEGPDKRFQIYFGDNVIGKKPTTNSTITAFYVVCSGSEGNDAKNFSVNTAITGAAGATVNVSTVNNSSGGRDRETDNSIKLNAVNSFGVQNRAVTASDYKSIILSSGVNLRSAHVWGGEDNSPPKYGAVFVCAQPTIGDFVLQSQKNQITELLRSKSVANTVIEFVDPSYVDLVLNTEVKYNKNTLDISTYDLEVSVLAAIVEYADNNINKFDSTFRSSNLMKDIDRVHASIFSNMTSFKLQKELSPILYQKNNYTFSFDNPLNNTLKTAGVYSTLFKVSEYSSYVFLEDDGLGNIQLMTTSNNQKTVLKSSIGTVDYSSGLVSLNNITFTEYDGQYLKITAVPLYQDVVAKNNTIVRIKSENVTVTTRAD